MLPAVSGVPRENSVAWSLRLPSNWTSPNQTAPCPAATKIPRFSTAKIVPSKAPPERARLLITEKTFNFRPPNSGGKTVYAPGHGFIARTRLSTASGELQAILPFSRPNFPA
jgi:hypothetical protein